MGRVESIVSWKCTQFKPLMLSQSMCWGLRLTSLITDYRQNSSGSRECLDSGSGREKEKIRDKRGSRDRDLNRDGRESARDRRDSGSGRDRRDVSKERELRDHREVRERRDRRRDRDKDTWSRDINYSRERDYRETRSRDRSKDYRDIDRHRKPRHSYDDEE